MNTILFTIALVSSATFLWLAITKFGLMFFAGYDCGGLINLAWQLHLGYRPYVDIVTAAPPLFMYGASLAFKLWPVEWSSLLKISAVFSILTFLMQVGINWKLGMGSLWSLFLAFVVQSITIVVTCWWWYNPITSVAASLFVTASILLIKEPSKLFSQFVFVLSTFLLALGKPNLAGVLLVLIGIVLVINPTTRNLSMLLTAISAILAVLSLLILGINPLALFQNYFQASGWALSPVNWYWLFLFGGPKELLQTVCMFLPAMVAFLLFMQRLSPFFLKTWLPNGEGQLTTVSKIEFRTEGLAVIAIALVGCLASAVAMLTNNDYKMSSLPPMLMGIAVIIISFRDCVHGEWFKKVVTIMFLVSLVLLTVNGFRIGYDRNCVRLKSEAFYEETPIKVLANPPFFKGLSSSTHLIRVLDEMHELMESSGYNGMKDAPIFFGPRINFGYAISGITPKPGLPLWWDIYENDARTRTQAMIQRFKAADFEMCIFLHRDYTYLPKSLINYLNTDYSVHDWGELTVHIRRKVSREPGVPIIIAPKFRKQDHCSFTRSFVVYTIIHYPSSHVTKSKA